MTYKQFEKAVKDNRNDIIVSRHGDYCNNISKTTLGIIFVKDGKESKVYDFFGTYSMILGKLNIQAIEQCDIDSILNYIEDLKKRDGYKDIFTGKVIDNSEEIKKAEATLESYKNMYMIK